MTRIDETSLRGTEMRHLETRPDAEGETDIHVFDGLPELYLAVRLEPDPEDPEKVFAAGVALLDQDGVGPAVVDKAGGELDDEALETLIWEKLDGDDRIIGYMEGFNS